MTETEQRHLRVLFLIDTLAVGGAERSMLEILSRLSRTEALMCHIYAPDTLLEEYVDAGVRVVSLDVPDRYNFRLAIRRVRELIREYEPDLIHTTLFRADNVGRIAGMLSRTPVISSFVNEAYNPIRLASLDGKARAKLRSAQMIDAATARLATHFVAVSQSCKRSNCQALHLSPNKITVIYRGRDQSALDNAQDVDSTILRDELGLHDDTRVLLSVGRLLDRKGHEDLIRAMPAILHKQPNTRLFIAGEGPHRATLQATINALALNDHATLLGTRRDVPALLGLADVFVFPSYYEGHPGALVEAMLAGKPIVASDIAVHREMLQDGESGMLTPVGDVEGYADAVCKLLSDVDHAIQMGHQAREYASSAFDIERIVDQYDDLYGSLVAEGHGGSG